MLFKIALKFFSRTLVVSVATVAVLMGSNVWTYKRLSAEVPVGYVEFEQLSTLRFKGVFVSSGGDTHVFVLEGDEWQLDAQVIKWKSWSVLLGAEPLFVLDRFNGRYRTATDALAKRPTLYDLNEKPWLDIWSLARSYPDVFGIVDAQYGSSVYLPMRDRQRFEIVMGHSGLVARLTGIQDQ